jgi:hypothetical protein
MGGQNAGANSEFDLEEYTRAGLDPGEAVRWKQARIEPIVARRAREVGLTLEQTAVGVREMWFPTELRKLLDRGVSLDELANWESAAGDAPYRSPGTRQSARWTTPVRLPDPSFLNLEVRRQVVASVCPISPAILDRRVPPNGKTPSTAQ